MPGQRHTPEKRRAIRDAARAIEYPAGSHARAEAIRQVAREFGVDVSFVYKCAAGGFA